MFEYSMTGMLGALPMLRHGRSRAINAENPTGEKGKGGMAAGPLGPSRKGSPCLKDIQPGESVVLGEIEGAGVINHIWMTVDRKTSDAERYVLRDLVLRMYWDSRGKQVLPGRAVCFSVPNISFFAFPNKGFVVSFFRNLALRNFLSAKSLNLRGCFGQIAFVCNFFDIFQSFSGTKNRGPTKKQGLLFSRFPSIMEKSPRDIVSF